MVGVAVGVEDADDRDVQLAGLVNGEVLLVGVDNPDGLRHAVHVADAAKGLGELVHLALLLQELFLRQSGAGNVAVVEALELLHLGDPLADRAEVGEHAAQPALVHEGHADAGRLLGDRFLGLLLGADEQDLAALGDGLLDERVGAVDVAQRLLQVDDVDAVALGEDELLHLRVPTTGLVPEVDATVQQLARGDDGHGRSSLRGSGRCRYPLWVFRIELFDPPDAVAGYPPPRRTTGPARRTAVRLRAKSTRIGRVAGTILRCATPEPPTGVVHRPRASSTSARCG